MWCVYVFSFLPKLTNDQCLTLLRDLLRTQQQVEATFQPILILQEELFQNINNLLSVTPTTEVNYTGCS